jgi:hypothetical protein
MQTVRNVVGVLVAAAVGIHCSAPATDSTDTSAPELVSPAAPAGSDERPRAPTAFEDGSQPSTHTETVSYDLSAIITDTATTHVTSTIIDDQTGALYATGTFVGAVVIGNKLVNSRGDKDVFVLKVDADGLFEWVRAVGSASAESAPRVALDDPARVNIVGMTKGEMDCGAGPLPSWSSETFFFCVFGGRDGSSLEGGVFPTGTP